MIDDEKFLRGKIPMTKLEIRILTLAKAKLEKNSIIVDIGAGTGSITIEAAKICSNGKIFAIERNFEAVELIKRNLKRFSVENAEIIHSEAPDGLENLPNELDAAIIGGKILDVLGKKLKIGGRIVINAITLQTAAKSIEYFRSRGQNYDACQIQITRLEKIGKYDMSKALNPVWIISAEKI